MSGTAATALMNKATQMEHPGRVSVVMYLQVRHESMGTTFTLNSRAATVDPGSQLGCLRRHCRSDVPRRLLDHSGLVKLYGLHEELRQWNERCIRAH